MASPSDKPEAFSSPDQTRIRAMLRDATPGLACPACGGTLAVGQPLVGGTAGDYWEITCDGCRRHMIAAARDVPRDQWPEQG